MGLLPNEKKNCTVLKPGIEKIKYCVFGPDGSRRWLALQKRETPCPGHRVAHKKSPPRRAFGVFRRWRANGALAFQLRVQVPDLRIEGGGGSGLPGGGAGALGQLVGELLEQG